MAEVIDMTGDAPMDREASADGPQKSKAAAKPRRKSKFTMPEDLIIVQEVSAAEAHVAPHGETLARFERAAQSANANPNFQHDVTGKNLQDRFKKLLDDFAARDAKDRNLSGAGGEIGELDELLGDLLEAKKDLLAKKDGDARERTEQERKKLAAGQDLILNALRGKDRKRSDDETPTKKRRLDAGDDMKDIGEALRESEAARFAIEHERLEFDRERLGLKDKQRTADREELAKERTQRANEVSSYRETMERMMAENGKQMQAVLGLATTILGKQKSP